MAAIGRLPDTLADRCIVIRMQRKSAHERCERLRNLEPDPTKRKCARFVLDNAAAIGTARPEIPAELHDRAADIWEPLLVLADLAGGEWPKRARVAAMKLCANSEEANPIGSLLLDLFVVLAAIEGERVFSRTLVQALNQRPNRPWAEARRGKPVTELWLSQQLRPYGLQPRTIWISGEQAKGYYREDLKEVIKRYLPRQEIEALKEEIRNKG
jgi:putative DNA primase/helicase